MAIPYEFKCDNCITTFTRRVVSKEKAILDDGYPPRQAECPKCGHMARRVYLNKDMEAT